MASPDETEQNNVSQLVDEDIKNSEDIETENKYNTNEETIDVDDNRQTYILSNYSTLRTNLQWNKSIISSIIDKISNVRILPPSIKENSTNMYIKREEHALQTTIENLQNPSKSKYNTEYNKTNDKIDIESSCKSIINYVNQRSKHDPLLSNDNPFKKEHSIKESSQSEEEKEEKKSNISNLETIAKTKTDQLSSLDIIAQKDEFKPINEESDSEFIDHSAMVEELLDDTCYQMLQEIISKNENNLIINADTDAIHLQMIGPQRKICSKETIKKSLKYTYLVGSRAFGLVDLITDGYLLYLSSQNNELYFLTLALVISISSPYIISYSSGVQLYLFRQTFDNVEGFKKILMILFLLPSGIFYFVFLDLADILLHIIRWLFYVICCRSLQKMGETEQILSEQLGMDRMNWEGFKRQRSIGQLMFESLPQFLFQTAIFYVFYDHFNFDETTQITPLQLFISIGSAMINIVSTTIKLKLESMCCKSTFISYCLICIKARVGWVPQREHILKIATTQERNRKSEIINNEKIDLIDYDMNHKILFYKHTIEYDFSVTTIRYLMSALQMINTTNNNANNTHKPLRIYFRNSLRLLPLQDIIELYSLCQNKNIDAILFDRSNNNSKTKKEKDHYDWSYAIKMSQNYDKDPRLLQFSRDDQGMPYIMKLMELSHYKARRMIFRELIEHDFDLNIHDLTTNESVVYTLIRSYDYKNLRYIFTNYGKDKGVLIRLNYHNKDGISPLGLALKLYEHELNIRKKTPIAANHNIEPIKAPYLWEILVSCGAELSFPCKKNYSDLSTDGDMSPLQFVLKELKHKDLVRKLMIAGAQLYSKEIGLLNELFVNYELFEEELWEPPLNLIEREEKKHEIENNENMKDDNINWNKSDDFIEHHREVPKDGSWLALLCEVAAHCGRPIDFITDSNGNNPLHHFINDFNLKNKHKTRRKKMQTKENKLKLKRLRHLMFICNGSWTNEKNKDSDYPFALIVKKRDPDLFFEFAQLDEQFKQSIMEKRIFVQHIIDWILSITERITKKYPQGLDKKGKIYKDERIAKDIDVQTLDKLFTVKYLGKLIQWPNKYKKIQGVEPISLIDIALKRKLIEVTEYLKKYWKFPVKKNARDTLANLKDARETQKMFGIEMHRIKSRRVIETTNNENVVNIPLPHAMLRGESELQRERGFNNRNNNSNKYNDAPAPVLRQETLMTIDNRNAGGGGFGDLGGALIGAVDRYKAQKSLNDRDDVTKHIKSKIETIYSFFVEFLSTADFITDILVVIALIKLKKSWEISFMLLFMISPYLVSHSIMCSLIDSRRDSMKLDIISSVNPRCCDKFSYQMINTLALILMTPLAIVWFTFVDVTFMIYVAMATFVFLISCGYCDISDAMDRLLFKKCLGMSRMQIIGYRRLRTLSQLLFETLPQIVLQSWILYKNQGENTEHINDTDIYISIGVAGLHFILEIFIIYLDARASKMSLSHYAVICLGARLNWVPYSHQIRQGKKFKDEQLITKGQKSQTAYNFENIDCDVWFFKAFGSQRYRIEYEFSPSSIKKLGEYFISLRVLSSTDAPSNPYLAPVWLYYYKAWTLPEIYLGKTCCRSLDVYAFAEFFRSADKKVKLISNDIDWTQIIFVNTQNISPENVYLKRLCEEFINYAEIKLIIQLAPVVNLNTNDIINYIFRVSSHNLLLILKKYYIENIHFGLSSEIMKEIYGIIDRNNWIGNYRVDPSWAKVIFLLMWYTRRTIYRHQDPKGNVKFIDNIKRYEFLKKAIDNTLPMKFIVMYDSNVISINNYDDGVNKVKTIMMNSNSADNGRTNTIPNGGGGGTGVYGKTPVATNISSTTESKKEESESNYQVAGDWDEVADKNGTYVVNLAEEDDYHEEGFEVDFEILECFKYFQHQLEKYLIDLTLRLKYRTEYLRIGNKELFKFFKKVFNKQTIDFLKLIINSPWNVLQQFPVHVRFAELFSRIDPVIRRLEMVHGYGKYLLCSSKYRQSNKSKPMIHIVAMHYDNKNIDEFDDTDEEKKNLLNSKQSEISDNKFSYSHILDIQTDPAYDGHQSLRTASYNDLLDDPSNGIQLTRVLSNNKVKKKYMYNKSDIMGISRIVIDLQGFEYKLEDRDALVGNIDPNKSLGKIELFTILPQDTKVVNDQLMMNKVILKEITFEELEKLNDKQLIIDLFDNEILGMFRPIYIGRDRIDLMPLKLNIQPSRAGIHVKCDQIEAQITYLLRRFIDATAMKFESVLHKACSLQNLEFIQFIHEYQHIFNCNALDDDYQNALHILCNMGSEEDEDDEPDLEIFNLVLSLRDIDVNQIRFDGKTPFKLLEENYKIDVEKKNEMLKQIAAMSSYRPIIHNKDNDESNNKVKNVLLFGNRNSGRHSLLKQLQIHYEKRAFSEWEKSVERSKIVKYLISSMKILIKHCGDDIIAGLGDDDAYNIYSIKCDNLQTIERLPRTSFDALERLWSKPAIQRVYYENGERLCLSDSVTYFFYRIKDIKKSNYIPTELDILRSPYHNEKTYLTSKSYRVNDDIASDLSIRWILPRNNKILSMSSNKYPSDIDTIIFTISLTSFMEINPIGNNNNNFIKSLNLFKKCCNDVRYNKCKFVLLFNKTDVLKKKIRSNNEILNKLLYLKENEIIPNIDPKDYWDWLDLVSAMFRYQHSKRTIFSYPLSAADPANIRSILKELEDIILQTDIPTFTNSEQYELNALKQVKWVAILDQSKNELNKLPQFSFDLSTITSDKIKQIANDSTINIDYNAMLYKIPNKNNKKGKQVNFLISQANNENVKIDDGFIWAKWKKHKKKIQTYPQSKGYWQILNENNSENNNIPIEHLNGILAVLHHKELRTQFDGFTIYRNPIKICFIENNIAYLISWWNMARMSKCNGIIVDNNYYLHTKSPLFDSNIQWNWYDNDNGETREYDNNIINQLECSYQSNIESNYPLQIMNSNQPTLVDEEEELKMSDNRSNLSTILNMEDRIFNHCMLTELNKFMKDKSGNTNSNEPPLYVLRFGFNPYNQISYMTQLRIYKRSKDTFARDVYRRYNGRNSTWPA